MTRRHVSHLSLSLHVFTFATTCLLVVSPATSAVIDITPAVTSGDVDEFAISPDGASIAFVGALDGDEADQAYIVPISGGAAVRLTPDGVGDVDGGIVFTPDGSGVVVRYGGGSGNIDNQMVLLPTDGSQAARQLTFNNTNVFDPQVSADGQTLFYIDALDTTPDDPEGGVNRDDLLYVTSISDAQNAPAPVLITPDDVAEIDTGGYARSGSNIIFAGSLPGEDETRFYSTPADGAGTPVEILITNAPAFAYDIDEVAVTPDGQSIIFIADLTTDTVDELYSMPIAGGEATQLLPAIQDFTDVGPFVISADGAYLAFQADYAANGVGEAYVLPISGGEPIRVSEDLTEVGYNADVVAGVGRIAFTPDGSQIVYLADGRANGVNEMFIVNNPLAVPEPNALLLGFMTVVGCRGVRNRR